MPPCGTTGLHSNSFRFLRMHQQRRPTEPNLVMHGNVQRGKHDCSHRPYDCFRLRVSSQDSLGGGGHLMAVAGATIKRSLDEQKAESPTVWRRALRPTVVVGTYLVLGLVAYWPVLPGISDHFFGRTADYVLSAWFIGWIPHAITHGLNPFFTNSMFVPTGVNLAQNTESPLLGLIGAPLTEAFGPLVTTNVLMVLAMPVSATAAFVVLRKWKVWLPGAALGGLLYGFSPYMVGQGSDHLVFTFVPIPPFIALSIVSDSAAQRITLATRHSARATDRRSVLHLSRGASRRSDTHSRCSRVRDTSVSAEIPGHG